MVRDGLSCTRSSRLGAQNTLLYLSFPSALFLSFLFMVRMRLTLLDEARTYVLEYVLYFLIHAVYFCTFVFV